MALSAIYNLDRHTPPMKLLLLSLLLATAHAAPASFNGKWKIQRNAAGRESSLECTFTQKENDLTGTCNTDRGAVGISGKVDGQKVTWTYRSDSEGGAVTVVYRGTADSANKVTGTVTAVEFGIEGEFTATQSN